MKRPPPADHVKEAEMMFPDFIRINSRLLLYAFCFSIICSPWYIELSPLVSLLLAPFGAVILSIYSLASTEDKTLTLRKFVLFVLFWSALSFLIVAIISIIVAYLYAPVISLELVVNLSAAVFAVAMIYTPPSATCLIESTCPSISRIKKALLVFFAFSIILIMYLFFLYIFFGILVFQVLPGTYVLECKKDPQSSNEIFLLYEMGRESNGYLLRDSRGNQMSLTRHLQLSPDKILKIRWASKGIIAVDVVKNRLVGDVQFTKNISWPPEADAPTKSDE